MSGVVAKKFLGRAQLELTAVVNEFEVCFLGR